MGLDFWKIHSNIAQLSFRQQIYAYKLGLLYV